LKPSEQELTKLRAALRQQKNSSSLAELFTMIDQLHDGRKLHPVFRRLYHLHESLQSLPRDLVSEAYTLANVYTNDPDLWQSFVWLQHNKRLHPDELIIRVLNSFAGVGGSWPSRADRDAVREKIKK
jgi:hypothetical protein